VAESRYPLLLRIGAAFFTLVLVSSIIYTLVQYLVR